MGKDFNPRFVFDAGPDLAAQSPWDFSGAAQDALRDASGGTTIDEKIQRALRRKQGRQTDAVPSKGFLQKPVGAIDRRRGVKQSRPASNQEASSEEDTDDEDLDGGSDSDKPLPGELSNGSDVELESAEEDEVEEAESSEEEEEMDRSPVPARRGAVSEERGRMSVPSKGNQIFGKGTPHIRRNDNDDDDDEEDMEEEGGEEEQEEEDGMGRGRLEEEASDDDGSSEGGSDPSKELDDEDSDDDEESEEDSGAEDTVDREADARRASGKAAGPSGRDQQAADAPASGGKNGSFFAATPKSTSFNAGRFEDLQLSRPLLKACATLGYAHPTPIQAAVIPLALMGRDICGSAMTGSGKTAAFTLPLLERLLYRSRAQAATYALILTPTRELAVQVHSMVGRLAQYTDIRAALVVGGLSLQAQATALRARPEIVVATPGRIIDHLRNTHSVGLEELQALVLDEADRLLHLGFSEDIKQIVTLTPRKRQTLLFSATMTEEVRQLAAVSLNKPVRLAADPAAAAPRSLLQEVIRVKGGGAGAKEALLLAVCARSFREGRTIVFFRTKQAAHRAKMLFGLAGLPPAAELHGNLTQAARLDALEKFRLGEAAFLLATDVAARGLDILGVEVVINFDAPDSISSYLHRIGRTARAGAGGRAVTFVEDSDRSLLKEVVKKMKVDLKARVVPHEVVQKWAARLEQLEPDVQRLVKEEKEETVLRKAEMEMRKAENLMEHEAEIQARPPRTWHQTPKQKKALAELERSALADRSTRGEEEDDDGEPGSRGKAGKKARKEREQEERKRKRAEDAAEAKRAARNSLMQETEVVAKKIRAVKSTEAKLRQESMAPGRAGRAAVASLSALSPSQKKRRKQKARRKGGVPEADADGGGRNGLFEGDGTGRKLLSGSEGGQRRSKVYPGGGRSGKLLAPGSGKSKKELNLLKRKGKGVKQFKSKARHKRRR